MQKRHAYEYVGDSSLHTLVILHKVKGVGGKLQVAPSRAASFTDTRATSYSSFFSFRPRGCKTVSYFVLHFQNNIKSRLNLNFRKLVNCVQSNEIISPYTYDDTRTTPTYEYITWLTRLVYQLETRTVLLNIILILQSPAFIVEIWGNMSQFVLTQVDVFY